jgi:DNA-binding beta-propeller fold protein YncE
VQVLDAATGKYLHTVGAGVKGGLSTQFSVPNGVAVLNGSLYVADPDNHRISVFRADTGEYERAVDILEANASQSAVVRPNA